jgi:hypothetical protein
LAAAGDRAEQSADAQATRLGVSMTEAVKLLLQGLRLRIERFEELETSMVQKRETLRREGLVLLAQKTPKAE